MQSLNLNKTHTVTEIFAEVIDSLKASTSASYSGNGEFEGDFSKFIFTENPANAFETCLEVGSKTQNGCKLVTESKIKVKDSRGYTIGNTYLIKERAPFFYDCNVKEVNGVETAQPAIWIPRPQEITLTNSNAQSLATEANLLLVLSDNSDHENWRVGDERSTGFYENKFNTYVEKPLNLRLNKLLDRLDNYLYTNGFTSQITITGDVKQTFVRRFGESVGLVNLGFDANLSGMTVEIPIKIYSTHCAKDL